MPKPTPSKRGLKAPLTHDAPSRAKAPAEDSDNALGPQARLARLTRFYSVLSGVNEAIVRVRDPQQLYTKVCRIIVEQGAFTLAWIGLLEPESREVRQAASYGRTDYLDGIRIVAADVPEGRGPTGRAVAEAREFICSDIMEDPLMLPWRQRAISHGLRSSASFPLRIGSEAVGALTIYSAMPCFFSDEEMALLFSLAEDISLAIAFIETERKRKEAEDGLRQLNEELERRVLQRTVELESVNRELDAFSQSVAHDLRAPLRFIDGFSNILLEDHSTALNEDGRKLLSSIRGHAGRMDELISALLSLARAGRQAISLSPLDMKWLAECAFDELKAVDPSREVRFIAKAVPSVKGDLVLIRQVLFNLMGNAWKFTSKLKDAVIEFGALQKGGLPAYYVRDNGAGFDPAHADRLFKPFQRCHSDIEFEGTGIGLAIVERIVLRHGGRVWAEGETGRGATFFFSLG